jgi:hypothetical protein
MSAINNFAKDGFQAQQQQVEGTVPAALLVELARLHYGDRESDRALARELLGQMMNLGVTAIEMARAEAQERADERAERMRNERREERQRQERNARNGRI